MTRSSKKQGWLAAGRAGFGGSDADAHKRGQQIQKLKVNKNLINAHLHSVAGRYGLSHDFQGFYRLLYEPSLAGMQRKITFILYCLYWSARRVLVQNKESGTRVPPGDSVENRGCCRACVCYIGDT